MTVHSQCTDGAAACVDPGPGSPLRDRRSELRSNCACAVEQHYVFRWDELNRLAEARRYDREESGWVRKVRQRYRSDAANVRPSSRRSTTTKASTHHYPVSSPVSESRSTSTPATSSAAVSCAASTSTRLMPSSGPRPSR